MRTKALADFESAGDDDADGAVSVKLDLPGHVVIGERRYAGTTLYRATAEGLWFRGDVEVPGGDVHITLRGMTRIHCRVVRSLGTHFVAVPVNGDEMRRMAGEVLMAARAQADAARRRHERVVPRNPATSVTPNGGVALPAEVIDISVSGAAIRMAQRPPVGAVVMIGRHEARVVRHLPEGFAAEFSRPLPLVTPEIEL